ncbi:MAG: O-acetylhomoserine aminocarboxypropyltransferase/cysteine synthase [Candidatus Palauibacterales bacterium]|nr:O-acetylhomoserine aminocarboxypropyltransferase/cysteine synthase [Candidatus Palauibacterales bacterium]MDP2529440.1 O-acetylhomoserine aminocarboxypropyltransferase/cysteine synthase [Candidatus Palauibacterales bacterium]
MSGPSDTGGRGADAPAGGAAGGSGAPEDRAWGFRTRAIHAGARPDPATGARNVPIYQTTSFVFEDTKDAADLFALQKYGHIYTRISNPTVSAFEERMASLEGGIGAVAAASGQAAEFLVVTALADAGDHILASSALYGGTYNQFNITLRRLGIDCTFVDGRDPEAFASQVRPETKLVYAETIGNPSGTMSDLAGLAEVAHAHDLPLVVDNTFASPYLCRPIEHGADIVVHSATKYIAGNGTTIGGVVVESGTFPWDSGRFPHLTEEIPSYKDLRWWGNFGEYAFCTKLRAEQLRDIGACLSPFNAFMFLQGLETLPVRMDAHVRSARAVAEWLSEHPRVAWVRYAGLPGSPDHDLALRYMPKGPGGGIFTFGVAGGREAGARFIESLSMISHLANVGDVRTLVIHPASTTHQQLSDEDLLKTGVTPDMVRISVGLEDVDDILWDLDRALEASS